MGTLKESESVFHLAFQGLCYPRGIQENTGTSGPKLLRLGWEFSERALRAVPL